MSVRCTFLLATWSLLYIDLVYLVNSSKCLSGARTEQQNNSSSRIIIVKNVFVFFTHAHKKPQWVSGASFYGTLRCHGHTVDLQFIITAPEEWAESRLLLQIEWMVDVFLIDLLSYKMMYCYSSMFPSNCTFFGRNSRFFKGATLKLKRHLLYLDSLSWSHLEKHFCTHSCWKIHKALTAHQLFNTHPAQSDCTVASFLSCFH